MATTKPRPGDVTGLRRQQQAVEHEVELAERADQISMTQQADAHRKQHEIVDYSGAETPLPEPELDEAELAEPYKIFRASCDIEDMVYGREVRVERGLGQDGEEHEFLVPGALRTFSFEEGRQYRVPRALYEHLDARGYVYH